AERVAVPLARARVVQGDEPVSPRAEGHRAQDVGPSREHALFLARTRVPQPGGSVGAAGQDACSVAAEHDAVHGTPVSRQLELESAACRVPDPRDPVEAAGGDPRSVRAEGALAQLALARDDTLAGAGGDVPDPRLPVRAGRDQAQPIGGTESDPPDEPVMTLENVDGAIRVHIP